MRKKNVIAMIVMIIGVFVLFNRQLSAEEVVGRSITTAIETPHPYSQCPQSKDKKKVVCRTTINQPGAAWIKIHFSKFQLDDKDFVNLINEQGKIIEYIRFSDVNGENDSKFRSQKNEDHTVNFWSLAVDGPKVTIELHCAANNPTAWGFKIDEIGVGSKPIIDRQVGPIYNDDKETTNNFVTSIEKNNTNFYLKKIITSEGLSGRMLYKKGTTWYTCQGNLVSGNLNRFLPIEACIDSQQTVDTLEVRFIFDFHCGNDDYRIYRSFYGDRFIDNYSDFDFGLLTLIRNTSKVESFIIGEKPKYKSELGTVYDDPCICSCSGVYRDHHGAGL